MAVDHGSGGGGNNPRYDNVYTFMNVEFTTSNYYKLSFDLTVDEGSYFILGHNPHLETLDGLFIGHNVIRLYRDNVLNDEFFTQKNMELHTTYSCYVINNGGKYSLYIKYLEDYEKIYETDLISWNTIGVYRGQDGGYIADFLASNFVLEPMYIDDITPSTETYDGSVFGSNWHIEFREDHLNFVDYGMLPSGANGGGLVILNEVPLPKNTNWDMEIITYYNNRRYDARLNALYGEIQARLFEDVSTSDTTFEYSNVLCSPSPIPNAKTIFTRHSDEGTLYYVEPDYLISDELGKVMQKPTYLCNAYNQYKGGVEMYTETGISLFNLDNAYSPVYVGNDLIRAEFHRRSGYIVISRYDELTDGWYSANVLKLYDNLKLSIQEYNDDYARVSFGGTTWEFYRGRPFIVVKHPNTNIRILKVVDRVYCETMSNEQGMGWIEEKDTFMSVFNPQTSIQKFKQELHIGENIRTDNFDLYEVDSQGNTIELEHNASLSTTLWDNETVLIVDKGFKNGKLALNFPSVSTYVKKPSNTFSLYIGKIDVDSQRSITIKARGFDDNGAIHIKEGVQYGLWEQSHTFNVDNSTEDIRATFNCGDDVKYIDFVIIFNTSQQSHIRLGQLMCHEGDSEPNWDIDYSMINANNVEITFDETYYANLYFEDAPVGLSIIRPTQESFSLRELKASKESVLVPYMKKSKEWDKPSQIFLEYLNASRQTIDIEWEEF